MVIEILSQKYKCDCGRGLAKYEETDLLDKLNYLIEWDFVQYPIVKDKHIEVDIPEIDENGKETGNMLKEKVGLDIVKEDKDFLKGEQELKPGNCFLLDGQIIAIDSPDRIVLVLSKTGRGSLDRIVEERIDPEYKMVYGNEDAKIEWEALTSDSYKTEYDGICSIPFPEYRIWRDRFVKGREDDLYKIPKDKEKGTYTIAVKATIKSESLMVPIDLVFQEWDVAYKTSEFDEDDLPMIQGVAQQIMAWFIRTYDRLVNPLKPVPTEQEQIDNFIKAYQEHERQVLKVDMPN